MQALRRLAAPRTLAQTGAAGLALLAAHSAYNLQTSVAFSAEAAFDPQNFKKYKLLKVEQLTPNTSLFRFALPRPDMTADLPVASCIVTKAPIGEDGKAVIRPYTPTSSPDAKGHFDLVVKVYPTGVMSKHFGTLKPGDELECKGPIMKLKYEPNMKKAIGMVAGGTGITPMLQVMDEIARNPNDKTDVTLVFANVTEKDIILKEHIDTLVAKHPNIKVHYVLDKPPMFWRGGSGFITADMLKAHLPAPGPESMVFVCGPPGLMESVSGNKAKDYTQGEVAGHLKALGYTKEMVFKF